MQILFVCRLWSVKSPVARLDPETVCLPYMVQHDVMLTSGWRTRLPQDPEVAQQFYAQMYLYAHTQSRWTSNCFAQLALFWFNFVHLQYEKVNLCVKKKKLADFPLLVSTCKNTNPLDFWAIHLFYNFAAFLFLFNVLIGFNSSVILQSCLQSVMERKWAYSRRNNIRRRAVKIVNKVFDSLEKEIHSQTDRRVEENCSVQSTWHQEPNSPQRKSPACCDPFIKCKLSSLLVCRLWFW